MLSSPFWDISQWTDRCFCLFSFVAKTGFWEIQKKLTGQDVLGYTSDYTEILQLTNNQNRDGVAKKKFKTEVTILQQKHNDKLLNALLSVAMTQRKQFVILLLCEKVLDHFSEEDFKMLLLQPAFTIQLDRCFSCTLGWVLNASIFTIHEKADFCWKKVKND